MFLAPAHEEYKIFTCSDCHPDYDDPKDTESEHYEKPYEVILPMNEGGVTGRADESCPVDNCPRCGSYLSMCSDSIVKVELVRQ